MGGLYVAMHVKIISQSALHPTRKREDEILEKKYEKRPYKYKKQCSKNLQGDKIYIM